MKIFRAYKKRRLEDIAATNTHTGSVCVFAVKKNIREGTQLLPHATALSVEYECESGSGSTHDLFGDLCSRN